MLPQSINQMKRTILSLIFFLAWLDGRAAIDHDNTSKWKSIHVEKLGITLEAPNCIYDADTLSEKKAKALGYVWHNFSLHTIRLGGIFSERRPVISVWLVLFSSDQYNQMLTDKGAHVGALLKRANTFHEKTKKYDNEDTGPLKSSLYRRDYRAANGSVLCVGVRRVEHAETVAFASEDEAAINRIINSVGFIIK